MRRLLLRVDVEGQHYVIVIVVVVVKVVVVVAVVVVVVVVVVAIVANVVIVVEIKKRGKIFSRKIFDVELTDSLILIENRN